MEILYTPPIKYEKNGGRNTEWGRIILLRRSHIRGVGVCIRLGGVFMGSKSEITKESKIKKETARLKKVFRDLDKNKLSTVESLIKNAAFMAVSLEELQEIINKEGYVSVYQNGENQSGTKQSDAVKTHISMTKNHASVVKQLAELVPPEKKKKSRLQALKAE